MLSSLATKVALKKVGLPSDAFNFTWADSDNKKSKKSRKNGLLDEPAGDKVSNGNWPAWMSIKSLPLTVQPWLTPLPPPIPVAEPPRAGDLSPLDRDRKLNFGAGKKVLVVFLRCVGCAFAQKTFLKLRALASRYPSDLTCIAVSHSSAAATQKWVELMGGAWNVRVVIDEDRAIYAAWGLGLGNAWYVFNPTSQVAGFKEKGWLGANVAGSLQRSGPWKKDAVPSAPAPAAQKPSSRPAARSAPFPAAPVGSESAAAAAAASQPAAEEGPTTAMGNKWQQAGAWAVDGRGKIVWGGKALRADDIMDLEAGVKALGLS
ncbi:hypothetical protein B0H63DRAFT_292157 [Podospora didyma]|uniref:Alkyl hydroperoxide reductase subunit C/ Thiol specific antioxidant domain-containing protein n=1 Tax=Podospora didyma TaxID=330526 RepID=A0AAE0N683_9PEZI|nr:hypothetical protein B0H63DRAFT_292157 [Podospora didyma]